MAINTKASFGSIPQHYQPIEGPGIKALFHSERELALIFDKTVAPGYGVLQMGTVMAECVATGELVPYPPAAANDNSTNAKAYILAQPSDADTSLLVNIEDSYKFRVGQSLILDGATAAIKEVQSAAAAAIATNDVFILSWGGVSASVTILATETLAALVALIQAHEDYDDFPFLVTAGTNALTLTWKVAGAVSEKATLKLNDAEPVPATTTTAGADQAEGGTAAEDLGAITAIDRTWANGSQARITFTTGVTTGANFSLTVNANVYVKGKQAAAATPFTSAKYILDKAIDTGVGPKAAGGLTSLVISNAILNKYAIVGLDSAAITSLGAIDEGNRFIVLK